MRLLASLVLVAIVGLLAACSQASPTPAAPASGASTGAAAPAAGKSFTFKYSSYMPATNSIDIIAVDMLKEVEKKAAELGYTVKIEYYWSESLVKAADQGDALAKGVSDIAWLSVALFAAKFPLFTLPNSMPMVTSDPGATANLMLKMYEWGPGKKEIEGNNMVLIGGASTDPYSWLGRKRVRTFDDMKGLRIAGYGLANKAFPAFGATSVSMSAPDMFTAVERGTIDGVIRPLASSLALKLQDVAKFYTDMNWYVLPVPINFNKDKWNSLPPDLQKVFLEAGKGTPATSRRVVKDLAVEGMKTLQAATVTVDPWSQDDLKKMASPRDKLFEEEGKSLDGKGLPGTEAMKNIVEWAAAYEKANPQK